MDLFGKTPARAAGIAGNSEPFSAGKTVSEKIVTEFLKSIHKRAAQPSPNSWAYFWASSAFRYILIGTIVLVVLAVAVTLWIKHRNRKNATYQ
jgi:hypothetical protein